MFIGHGPVSEREESVDCLLLRCDGPADANVDEDEIHDQSECRRRRKNLVEESDPFADSARGLGPKLS